MIKQIRTSKITRVVAAYLAVMIFLEVTQPMVTYALTSGPKQPEFTAFTPIGTSDMVDLSSGDFNYNIPIMDVGGYPINLAYNSGVTMDQEASWVGLGWNLNVGQISRQVRGLPDDFKGDPMRYENDMRDNITAGTNFKGNPAVFGKDFPFSLGLGVEYNNYEGITFKPSLGISFGISEHVRVGLDFSSSTADGASVSPAVTIQSKDQAKQQGSIRLGSTLSSRQGFQNLSMSVASQGVKTTKNDKGETTSSKQTGGSISGSISLNMTHNHTPSKRVGYTNRNISFNAALGTEVYGGEAQGNIAGYASKQSISSAYKDRLVGGYGYDFTHHKGNNEGVLDFNRENENTINKNTTVLPVTNYTYDVYNIEGQGVSGMFRPMRSQVGYVYNDNVEDKGGGGSGGVEIGPGGLVHTGFSGTYTNSYARTGKWVNGNNAFPAFEESDRDVNNILYQPVSFKMVGELNVDNESSIYTDKVFENKTLVIPLQGKEFNRSILPIYKTKDGATNYSNHSILSKIKRTGRMPKNQLVEKITNQNADDKFIFKNENAKPHHTAGIKVLKTDGTTYVYGKTAYNTTKVEATFDISGRALEGDKDGLSDYSGSLSGNGKPMSDHYKNKITTPSYAHTYLMTSILSSDYQDIDNNGISDNDLGNYTKFEYTQKGDNNYVQNYKWRVPFACDKVSVNEGLKSSTYDQKGNYIYGEKELVYLKTIETKTHIAFIDLEDRDDARSASGETGKKGESIFGSEKMKRIKSIRLYSKSELQKYFNGKTIDPIGSKTIFPIKTAHFEYDYSLCMGIPSSNNGQGKLTLKKVYFTYRNSSMGKYTPYDFSYQNNMPYKMKAFDTWGNYKELNKGGVPNSEYPFVEQNQAEADQYTGAWTLEKIKLPSGGEIKVTTESDDYAYVQNKKAMQMFKVVGAGSTSTSTTNNQLYEFRPGERYHNRYIYVKVPDATMSSTEFKKKYLSENFDKMIYFKFLLNMTKNGHEDYVSGYFEIDKGKQINVENGIASIPVKFVDMDGGLVYSNKQVNPISKTGWGFGRMYLNRIVYSLSGDEKNDNVISVIKDLVGSIGAMKELVTGPNRRLEEKGCAQTFNPQKSWVRLENPDGKKLGGGLRVKKVELSDDWSAMNSKTGNDSYIVDPYNESYGQEYSYTTEDGTSSSGVATFEPNASPENPFVEPFYAKEGKYADKISSPKENNFVELPFGESFFPSAKVTYSRVSVKNLNKDKDDNMAKIKKHATGKVVTNFYTTKDFPTKLDFTAIELHADSDQSNLLLSLLTEFSVMNVTASQGFSIETNDMNGKIKSEEVYAEDGLEPISKVEYKYNVDAKNQLDNSLTTINSKGKIEKKLLGVDYDVINDFNESTSSSTSFGLDFNLATFIAGIFPAFVPVPFPRDSDHKTKLQTATTTKVVHKTGILTEKIAYDGGSKVSTKNLAWDAQNGQVILTETINEFDDKYYSFNYPAYWYYKNMGLASDNIGLEDYLSNYDGDTSLFTLLNIKNSEKTSTYFNVGDELELVGYGLKLWVYDFGENGQGVRLMTSNGGIFKGTAKAAFGGRLKVRVIKSGNKNMQMLNMASVTSMNNPIDKNGDGIVDVNQFIDNQTFMYTTVEGNKKVVNASAIEYSDDWASQCENGLPDENRLLYRSTQPVNPYLYNIKGNWRPIKSYAYLSGRNNHIEPHRRHTGFFTDFNPFYKIETNKWSVDKTGWTSASEVTKHSPYGAELENKDALNRYSSAQYGYKYTLPVAVASNSQYREMGFDGFEDYENEVQPSILKPHFGFSQAIQADAIFVTSNKSHTGQKSLGVKSGKKAEFIRKVDPCKPIPNPSTTTSVNQ